MSFAKLSGVWMGLPAGLFIARSASQASASSSGCASATGVLDQAELVGLGIGELLHGRGDRGEPELPRGSPAALAVHDLEALAHRPELDGLEHPMLPDRGEEVVDAARVAVERRGIDLRELDA